MKENKETFDSWLEAIKPTQKVEVPEHLFGDWMKAMEAKKAQTSLSLWQYAAAIAILLINLIGVYQYSKNQEQVASEASIVEEMASNYNWNSNDYYNY
ncbi:hypothetical protein N6H18_08345 [Reichenbachiella agarivorans]|uniref:PH domain-containing protein n=1 Tax=Reichenbachiella agarivorans TaxID=2979464 RepID=A0ABY6CWX3_9BACT|nr:hypothetical protein [Reichenbachiella agarivorans]UXP33953.1 hypothetical protein N6H18_08345 [Reichenbachiella agarivorans]